MWDQLTVGYLAGIIEGEGSIQFNKWKRKTPSAKVCVSMTDLDTIQRLQEMSELGSVTGPYTRHSRNPLHKPYYMWTVYRAVDVLLLLETILPLMSKRRTEKIMEAIETLQFRLQPRPCEQCSKVTVMRPQAKYCERKCGIKAA